MRAVFIGCVETSRVALQTLAAMDEIDVCGVLSRAQSKFNSDFVDLSGLAADIEAVLYQIDVDGEEGQVAWLKRLTPDVIFCIGWSSLLPRTVLDIPPAGCIGYHPAALPQNRGRHPIIWALALGLSETASTFFRINEEADGGEILSQLAVPISPEDDAHSLYGKLVACMPAQLTELTKGLAEGRLQGRPQMASQANAWRKRGKDDGRIDWRMSAVSIYNLVRALSAPYPGAHFVRGDDEVKVWRVEIVPEPRRNLEPGKIIAVSDGKTIVKCGEDAVRLVDAELDGPLEVGAYL